MKPHSTVISGEEKRVFGSDYERDFYPTKENPLVIEVRMLEDVRQEWNLHDKAANHGCTCSEYTKALWAEMEKRRAETVRNLEPSRVQTIVLPAKPNRCN
jgi:hypothetical protein